MSRAAERELRLWLAAAGRQLGDRALGRILNALSPGERMTMDEQWPLWTVKGQEEPGGDWRVWLMMAGGASARPAPARNG